MPQQSVSARPRKQKRTTSRKQSSAPTAKSQAKLRTKLDSDKTDEELFADFQMATRKCPVCKGTKRVKLMAGRLVSSSKGKQRCLACKLDHDRIFRHWLDRKPPDGKRSWRTRIESYVHKNYEAFHQVVGFAVDEEDIVQEVMAAVWMVWDRYYNPNYLSAKTGRPVKLCTYVWRAIQTAWAKVTERCFCVRNTVHIIRKEDALSAEHQPIHDPGKMKSMLAKMAGLDPDAGLLDDIIKGCRAIHSKQPFTPAMLEEVVVAARRGGGSGEMLPRIAAAVLAVAKKRRNAVPAHMLMKSLDSPAGEDDDGDGSKNSDMISDIDRRLVVNDGDVTSDLTAQVRAIVSSRLSPLDQHILFRHVVSGTESIRVIASQYHLTIAEIKERVCHVREWLEDAKQSNLFDGLLE